MKDTRTRRFATLVATTSLALAGLMALTSAANATGSTDRHQRYGVSMALSSKQVTAGSPVTATGQVQDRDAVGRVVYLMAWNGQHFAPIAQSTVQSDRSYVLTGVIDDDTVVLAKLRKHYHVRRAGISHKEVVRVLRTAVSAPTAPAAASQPSDPPSCTPTTAGRETAAICDPPCMTVLRTNGTSGSCPILPPVCEGCCLPVDPERTAARIVIVNPCDDLRR